MKKATILTDAMRRHFRDDLRKARASVLRDAEAFDAVLFAIERLGRSVSGHSLGLGKYCAPIADQLFGRSDRRDQFEALYGIVREARNDAMHQGAVARHLAQNCVALALMIEDQLAEGLMRVADFMVRHPLCAETWQTLALLRGAMLASAFSYLPFLDTNGTPAVLVDTELMRYLRGAGFGAREKAWTVA